MHILYLFTHTAHVYQTPILYNLQIEWNKSLHSFCIIDAQPVFDNFSSLECHRTLTRFLSNGVRKSLFGLLLRWLMEVCFTLQENNFSEVTCWALSSKRQVHHIPQGVSQFSEMHGLPLLTRPELRLPWAWGLCLSHVSSYLSISWVPSFYSFVHSFSKYLHAYEHQVHSWKQRTWQKATSPLYSRGWK